MERDMETEIFYPVCARIPTPYGEFQLCIYLETEKSKEHLALIIGDLEGKDNVLVRVHSECFTGDVLSSLRCDCGEQLQRAMAMIAEAGKGVIIYLRQEGRGIGLQGKLRAYNLQDEGYDTVDANLALGHQVDERDYSCAARILTNLGVKSVSLITNNPTKIEALTSLGIDVRKRVPMIPTINPENIEYISTKIERMHHLLDKQSLESEVDDNPS
jgi:GTP cyclohydrolase II